MDGGVARTRRTMGAEGGTEILKRIDNMSTCVVRGDILVIDTRSWLAFQSKKLLGCLDLVESKRK